MNFEIIIKKHEKVINKAIAIMQKIKDPEHDFNHILDVLDYTKEIIQKLNKEVNIEVCIISAYFHDVGRSIKGVGHEKISADMLKEELLKNNYEIDFINSCYEAIINHKHNMIPTTLEGKIVKDADKLGVLGKRRWQNALNKNYSLDSIIDNLPKVRNEVLYFDVSKKIFDRELINVIKILNDKIYKKS
jgi:HD superfamily phosphodiesterase